MSRVNPHTSSAVVEDEFSSGRHATEPIEPTIRAEPDDLQAKWIWMVGASVLLVVWLVVVLVDPLFRSLERERTGGSPASKLIPYIPALPPIPRNESDTSDALRSFRAREAYFLTHYSWIDRDRGIVSIPIDRAIDILAQRGIPPSAPGGDRYYPPHAATMRTGFEGKVEPTQP